MTSGGASPKGVGAVDFADLGIDHTRIAANPDIVEHARVIHDDDFSFGDREAKFFGDCLGMRSSVLRGVVKRFGDHVL